MRERGKREVCDKLRSKLALAIAHPPVPDCLRRSSDGPSRARISTHIAVDRKTSSAIWGGLVPKPVAHIAELTER